jgi:hypothetical protein
VATDFLLFLLLSAHWWRYFSRVLPIVYPVAIYQGTLYQWIIRLCRNQKENVDDRFSYVLQAVYSLLSGSGPRYRGTLYQGIILLCCNQRENRLDLLQKSSCQDFYIFSVKYFTFTVFQYRYRINDQSLYFFLLIDTLFADGPSQDWSDLLYILILAIDLKCNFWTILTRLKLLMDHHFLYKKKRVRWGYGDIKTLCVFRSVYIQGGSTAQILAWLSCEYKYMYSASIDHCNVVLII